MSGPQTVTLVFTDLVDSTGLAARLGEERADRVRQAHFALLERAALVTHGEVVKNLGDGIMAAYRSAADSLRGAVTMQQVVDRENRESEGEPLGVRIGVSTGDANPENGDWFGTPVIEAARLCAAAEGGHILVSDVVRVLSGGRGGHVFTAVGSLSLKGLAEPLPTCEVTWEALPSGGETRLPPVLDVAHEFSFVGRAQERALLATALKEAEEGGRRMVLVSGEPGIGKTRLAAELAHWAHARAIKVLYGRCDQELAVPYQPFVEALEEFVTASSDAELIQRLGPNAESLARLVPEIERRGLGTPSARGPVPEAEQQRLFDAVAAWVSAASIAEPLLFVIDDLHWATKPTQSLLRHLVESNPARRLVILATHGVGREHHETFADLLAELRRSPGVTRIRLGGLSDAEVVKLVQGALGDEPGDESHSLGSWIHAETGGNPFFVTEVVRSLIVSGVRRAPTGHSETDLGAVGVPEGVREVVGERLLRLSTDAHDLLVIASVIGLECTPPLLRAVAHLAEEAWLNAMEELVAGRFLEEVPGTPVRLRFPHALVRSVVYDGVGLARRAQLHQQVGQALEAVYSMELEPHLSELAYQYGQAARYGDAAKAIEFASRAGDRALEQFAHDEAIDHYRRALDLLGPDGSPAHDERRRGLLHRLSEAQRRAGDPAYRQTQFLASS